MYEFILRRRWWHRRDYESDDQNGKKHNNRDHSHELISAHADNWQSTTQVRRHFAERLRESRKTCISLAFGSESH